MRYLSYLLPSCLCSIKFGSEESSVITMMHGPTASLERNDQCGNQHHSRELLMMGIVVPETC